MKLDVLNKNSEVVGGVELSVPQRASDNRGVLFNRVVRAMLMNARHGNASAKTRGEVSGGGKKPWKQKGTGRARAGSIRSPLFVGGGVVFPPRPKDYNVKMNKKEKKLAFIEAIVQRVKDGGFIVLDELNFEKPKTKEAYNLLKNLKIDKALIVLENGMHNAYLSLRNIKGIEVKNIDTLNTYDLLRFNKIIAPKGVIDKINRRISDG